jgi:hypothetical protein
MKTLDMKSTAALLGVAFLIVTLMGCAARPQAELDAAQAALTTAQEAGAEEYVTELYQDAQDSLAAAQEELGRQDARLSVSRDYERATHLLQESARLAGEATARVDERREEVRLEVNDLIADAQDALVQTQQLIAQAPRNNVGQVSLVSIQEDTASAEATLNEAIAAQAEGRYTLASELAQAALDQANILIDELNETLAGPPAPVPARS